MLKKDVQKTGAIFVYDEEILDHPRLAEVVRKARPAAKDCGLFLISELDFAENNGSKGGPLCKEPWETLYVLKRGVRSCCYTRKPIVNWSERGQRSLEEFLKAIWNGSPFSGPAVPTRSGWPYFRKP